MRRFLFGWLMHELRQINDKLDFIIDKLEPDFSKEDSAVLGETKTVEKAKRKVEEAKGRIPH